MARGKFPVRSGCGATVSMDPRGPTAEPTRHRVFSIFFCAIGVPLATACGNKVVLSTRGPVVENSGQSVGNATVGQASGTLFGDSFNKGRPAQLQAPDGTNVKPLSLATDSAGRIVVVGSISANSGADFVFPLRDQEKHRDMVVARRSSDGTADASFGPDRSGIVKIEVRSNNVVVDSRAYQVATIADGGLIVVGGYGAAAVPSAAGNFVGLVAARLKANGQLDPAFGSSGIALIPCPAGGALPAGVAVSGEKILIGGTCNNPDSTSPRMVLRQLSLSNGAMAGEFRANTRFDLPSGDDFVSARAYSMMVTKDGQVMIAGSARKGSSARELAMIQSFRASGEAGLFSYVNAEGDGDAFVMGLVEGSGSGIGAILSTSCAIAAGGKVCVEGNQGIPRDMVTLIWFMDAANSATRCHAYGIDETNFVPFAVTTSGSRIIVGGARRRDQAGFTLTSFEVNSAAKDCQSSIQWPGIAGATPGFVSLDPVGRYDFVRAMTAGDGDGRVLIAGPTYSNSDSATLIGRYLVR